jgi:hypothetical protein
MGREDRGSEGDDISKPALFNQNPAYERWTIFLSAIVSSTNLQGRMMARGVYWPTGESALTAFLWTLMANCRFNRGDTIQRLESEGITSVDLLALALLSCSKVRE